MICPNTLAASITAAAIALSEGKSSEDINLLGAIFTQLGDTLDTISIQQSAVEQKLEEHKKNSMQ